jgi:serine/threonine protein kinase
MSGVLHKAGDIVGDRYQVQFFIAEGGMQEVYRAYDHLLSREVALKVPKNISAAKRFNRSAVVSAKVNHSNVAKTLDYVEEAGQSYLIEEFIAGKDLARVLREDFPVLDPLLGSRLFHHLAKGLAASHHVGVIHRDLKPSNIMAVGGRKFEGVKITDFGIAKMAEEEIVHAVEGGEASLTASNTAIGALPYMAPEMINSVRAAGSPADIWSLGALMYELISGDKPFGTGYRSVPKIIAAKPPPMPGVIAAKRQFAPAGDELHRLILACLKANPDQRMDADGLVAECEKLCYPDTKREFGVITTFTNRYWGFITPESGDGVFFHVESVFGNQRVRQGDEVWFGRHAGGGNDRAFPVLKVRS